MLVPHMAYAQNVSGGAATTFASLAKTVVGLLNTGSVLLISAVLVLYMLGGFMQVYGISQGKVKGSSMTSYFAWGIGILFVMVSIWGIVQFFQYTLFNGPSPNSSDGVTPYSRSL
ncbi:MAG: hypothetical protein JWO50_542 [Candidatus Kaiserbacteria bacterium]|nr:hypothetical protein [Candidatus Kaiserbacteria bacterium]